MGDFQRSDPGNQRARPPAEGPFSLLIQLLLHLTARFRQRAAFDKDELLGCLQVLLFIKERFSTRKLCAPCAKLKERRQKWIRPSESEATALAYANIVRALRQVERATAKMDPAE